jgi:hypothetical protein
MNVCGNENNNENNKYNVAKIIIMKNIMKMKVMKI